MKQSNYQTDSNVVCISNYKSAALYFDKVLPLYLGSDRGVKEANDWMMGYPAEEIPSRALIHLIDNVNIEKNSFVHAHRVMQEIKHEAWFPFAKKIIPYGDPYISNFNFSRESNDFERIRIINNYKKIIDAYFNDSRIEGVEPIRKIFNEYASKVGINTFDVLQFNYLDGNKKPFSDPSVTLANLNLIDTSNSSWEQIIELRKDEQAHFKLKRLKLFLAKNYEGCSLSFIEDDLSQLMFDYEETCKKFGFNTMTSSISLLLDSNNLQTALGASLIAAIFGGPLSGLAIGATIEIGKLAINYAEKKHELRNWKNGHNLAYIFEANKKLQ